MIAGQKTFGHFRHAAFTAFPSGESSTYPTKVEESSTFWPSLCSIFETAKSCHRV
jgi:hypothetical protein